MTTPLAHSADEIAALCVHAPPAVAALLVALLEVTAQQEQTITDQAQTMATLTAHLRALEDQLSRTSHNSHQPPASDGLKQQPRSLRQRSARRPGCQPGHPGQTLTLTAHPDVIIGHRPPCCAGCGADLTAVPTHGRQRRQVVDLPPLQLQTVEHQGESVRCPTCQQTTSGQFPPAAGEPVQYAPRLPTLIVYLHTYQLLPSERTQELLADLFGVAPSEGTLATSVQSAAARLAPLVETIRQGVVAAAVAHFDETGCYVADKRYWLHVACTTLLTYYGVHPQRGPAGSTAAGVLPDFRGIAGHDAYASYYQALVATGLAANPLQDRSAGQERGRVKQSPATNLLLRLRDQAAEVLHFLHDLRVPFDNNQAERDVRMMKVQQKICGRFRSAAGATVFCVIRSYISTLHKQGLAILEALEQAFCGTPLLPATLG